jgi:hypothetical protein
MNEQRTPPGRVAAPGSVQPERAPGEERPLVTVVARELRPVRLGVAVDVLDRGLLRPVASERPARGVRRVCDDSVDARQLVEQVEAVGVIDRHRRILVVGLNQH